MHRNGGVRERRTAVGPSLISPGTMSAHNPWPGRASSRPPASRRSEWTLPLPAAHYEGLEGWRPRRERSRRRQGRHGGHGGVRGDRVDLVAVVAAGRHPLGQRWRTGRLQDVPQGHPLHQGGAPGG
ncbi:hypothetical protein ACFPN0_10480 [Kitasatospora cinereorecta]